MRRPRRGAVMVGLLIGTLLGPWGCTTSSPRIPPLSEEVRTQIGTLGIATSSIVPTADLNAPTGGKGAVKGAGQATLAMASAAGISASAGRAGGLIGAIGVLVVLGVTPVAALGGAIYGAIVAPSAQKVKGAETTLANALADLKIQEAIHDHVLQAARDRVGHRVVSLGETPDVDAILEIDVPSVRLAGTAALDIDPPLHLVVLACPKLVRRADGLQLYPPKSATLAIVYMSGPRKFLEWGGEDARLFREEMERAYQSLTITAVEEMFMVSHPPAPPWLFGDPTPAKACPPAGAERKR